MSHLLKPSRRVLLLGALAAPALLNARWAQAATQLRLTHPADSSHPVHIAIEGMVERIKERTNGEVVISVFGNNTLGSPTDTAQQTRLGAIDFIVMNPANIEALSNTIGVINIPYQFDDASHAHKVLDETGREWLAEQLKGAGFEWIANFEWGFRALSNSKQAVNSPEDVKGMKVRVPPELAIKAAFEALDASTQTVAFQEVYLALANKMVDGQDNPVATTYAAKFFEAQNHLALTKHIYATTMMAANPKVWARLSPEHQAIIREEAIKAGNEARAAVATKEEEAIKAMEAAGVAVTRPDVAPFRAKMGPAYTELQKAIPEDVWVKWQGFVEAAR